MSTKFLFLDYRLYEYSRGFERRLNQPVAYSGNPIMEPELPQEFNRVLLYGSVIRDPESGLLRMWYNSSTREESRSNLLYAESDDGYGWRKPALDVIPGTNIVMDNDWDIHGPTITSTRPKRTAHGATRWWPAGLAAPSRGTSHPTASTGGSSATSR